MELTPGHLLVLVVLAAVLIGRTEWGREAVKELFSDAAWFLQARALGVPVRVLKRLQKDRWNEMVQTRGLRGLKRGLIRRTKVGVSVGLKFGGCLDLGKVQAALGQLETGLDIKTNSTRLKPGKTAQRATLHIVVRDPLADGLPWKAPDRAVRLKDRVLIARTPFGDDVRIDVRHRIGIFGTSGSGKSCVQRLIGAHVIQSADADLELWDLKQGLESQHYEGKAHRVTESADAVCRTEWLLNEEFPRRAALMKQWKTSSWPESKAHPARVVMIDEGNVITRDFKPDQLKRFFTAVEQGRALGVYFVWVTQYPKATNLPTELRSQLDIRMCLRLLSSEESAMVFKDEVKDGWQPHKLKDYWILVKSSKHHHPEEARVVWLDEDVFKKVRLSGARPVVSTLSYCAPDTDTAVQGVPEDLVRWLVPGQTDRPGRTSVRDDVLSVLSASGRPMGVREVAREAGRDPGAVQRALAAAVDSGDVVRSEDKKYSAAGVALSAQD